MSRIFVCLFMLFILSIAIRFAKCDDKNIIPDKGSQPNAKYDDKNFIFDEGSQPNAKYDDKNIIFDEDSQPNAKYDDKNIIPDKGSSHPNAKCDNIEIKPGSDKTCLVHYEKFLSIMPSNPLKKFFEKDSKSKGTESSGKNEKKSWKSCFQAIFPGTLWCGAGDKAKNDSDLGYFKSTDACCREHDKCTNNIIAGEIKKNLFNNGRFTRSACYCDFKFYNCLKNTTELIACEVGKLYFNILRPQCFKCICPDEKCNLNDGTECNGYCKKYEWTNNNKF